LGYFSYYYVECHERLKSELKNRSPMHTFSANRVELAGNKKHLLCEVKKRSPDATKICMASARLETPARIVFGNEKLHNGKAWGLPG
jgi:hypothetical protein